MKKEIYLPIIGIAAGELMLFFGEVNLGMAVHIINLQVMTLFLIYSSSAAGIKNALQSLSLLLLMRIVNLAMPQFFTVPLLLYPFIYGVMLIPVYLIIKNQQISLKEIGINFRRMYIYMPAAFLIGSAAALIEYRILNPAPLIENTSLSNLILIATVMFVFVAGVEELIFRSILQTRLEKVAGLKYAVLLSGIMFGIMHAGYGILNEILFASIFGIFLGYIFQKTENLPFIIAIHGTANVFLFGLLPFII